MKEYFVIFDDGTFASDSRYVTEYPDAKLFTKKTDAFEHGRSFVKPHAVMSTTAYAEGKQPVGFGE